MTNVVSDLPPEGDAVVPFRVSIPQADVDDLKSRIAATRWPGRQTVNDWGQGVPLERAKALVEAWRDSYDWRAFEARLNAFPQFRTRIDGLGFHFIHVKSRHSNALPVIMTHGWPGSIIEFLDVISPLTDPTAYGGRAEDAFDVVIPSLPGFGFSDQPAEVGWDILRTANAWAVLMDRLGYKRWVAQGGDLGAAVTTVLAKIRPPGLVAAHVNWPLVVPETLQVNPSAKEQAAFDARQHYFDNYGGYFKEQSIRPQTLGYGLADTPAGQAAWLYDFLHQLPEHRGDEDTLPVRAMLDDISLYWFTNSSASSARYYWENFRIPAGPAFNAGTVDLPMAASIFPGEIYVPPKAWAEALWSKLYYWNEVDRGGHFAAWEQPDLFVAELRKAFQSIREA